MGDIFTPIVAKKAKVDDKVVNCTMVGKEVDSPARKNAAILNGVASTRGQSCQCGDFTCAKRKSAADSKCRGILSD